MRPKFKQKCKICHQEWVVVHYREFPICVKCHLRQIFSEEVTEKKYGFLNISKELYEKSRFLRNIRQAYLMYKNLTEKQVKAFKKTVKEMKGGKGKSDEEKERSEKEDGERGKEKEEGAAVGEGEVKILLP